MYPFKDSKNFADCKSAYESRRGNNNRKLLDGYDLNELLANIADRLERQNGNAQQTQQRQQQQPRSAQRWHIQAPRIRVMRM